MIGATKEKRWFPMLGARIGLLRRARGLSQAQLAELLQISPSTMGMYEQGRREPSLQTVVALSRHLGVSTDFLLTGQAVTPEESTQLEDLLAVCVETADRKLSHNRDRPFSRQELTTLFAALLTE